MHLQANHLDATRQFQTRKWPQSRYKYSTKLFPQTTPQRNTDQSLRSAELALLAFQLAPPTAVIVHGRLSRPVLHVDVQCNATIRVDL